MFGLFKKKSKIDKLDDQYNRLLKEAHQLSTTNRKASDEKMAEANEILLEIEKLTKNSEVMGFYQFKRKQRIKASVADVWQFISSPKNLKVITPDYMGFDIESDNLDEQMYEGMIIAYRVSPLLGIKTTWVTEITHIKEQQYFVDEQRVGPYSLWHHQHIIEPDSEGTMMSDIVSYKPPFGIIGSLANSIIIKNKLNEIFDYRTKAVDQYFK